MMLRLFKKDSVNTSFAILKYCLVQRYIYTCHNNTTVRLVSTKCKMKWEERGIQSKVVDFREQGIVFLFLFTIRMQNKSRCLQNLCFFPIYECFVVSCHMPFCQMQSCTANCLCNKLFTRRLAQCLG